MSEGKDRRYRSNVYFDDNAARRIAPEPKRVGRQNEMPSRRHGYAIGAHPHVLSAPYVVFLAVLFAFCLLMCVTYLHVQSDISGTKTSISQLRTEINTLQMQNDALQYSMRSKIDTDYVYNEATENLGMAQAKEDQISKYSRRERGFTVQYGDIPKE